MKRNAIHALQTWKENLCPTLFYLHGVRGTGKTYLAYEFAKDYFDSFFYFNCETAGTASTQLEELSLEETSSFFSAYFETSKELLHSSLLILDEISFCPTFFQRLLAQPSFFPFCLVLSSYQTVDRQKRSHITELTLYPLQFDEFLAATGHDWYIEVIEAHYKSRKKIPDIVHQDLLSIFDEYLWIGGMPDCINEYLNMDSALNLPERQKLQRIRLLYEISQGSEDTLSFKCQQMYSVIEDQLAKHNQKFQFNRIRKGTTFQMYKDVLAFLEQHGFVYRVNELEKEQSFKLFYSDFALHTAGGMDGLGEEERSLRIQNYIVQTFFQKDFDFHFWESKSQASLDYVLTGENCFFPVELKLDHRNKAKSIFSFQQTHRTGKNIRISDSNFVENDEFFNLPLYSAFCMQKFS